MEVVALGGIVESQGGALRLNLGMTHEGLAHAFGWEVVCFGIEMELSV